MNILMKENLNVNSLTFADLKCGDIFREINCAYLSMRIDTQDETGENAVDLQSGVTFTVSDNTSVEKYMGQAIFDSKAFVRGVE